MASALGFLFDQDGNVSGANYGKSRCMEFRYGRDEKPKPIEGR